MNDFTSDKGGLNITWKIENINCLADDTYCISPKFEIGLTRKTEWIINIHKNTPIRSFIYLKRENKNDPSVVNIESTVLIRDSLGIKKLVRGHQVQSYHCNTEKSISSFDAKELDFSLENIIIIHLNFRDISNFDSTVYRCFFQSLIEVEHRKGQFLIPHFSFFSDYEPIENFPLSSNCENSIPFEMTILKVKNEKIEIKIAIASKTFDTPVTLLCKLCFENIKLEQVWSAQHRYEFFPNEECVWNLPSAFEYSCLSNDLLRKKDYLYLKYELLICEQKQRTWLKKYEVEPRLSDRNIIKTADKEKANLRDDLMCLYVEQKCPDVEISVGDKKFSAHKTILSARSPVFSAMFENDMLEKKSNIVEISDIDAETVDRMLFFMYSEILSNQDWFNVINLYKASDKYQIITLKDKCSEIIQDQLTTLNACDALLLADKYYDKELLISIQDYIVTHSKSIVNSDKWEMIMDSQPKLACKIMHRICVKYH